MKDNKTCERCNHWTVFAENNMAGTCCVLGAIIWPEGRVFEEIVQPATEERSMKLQAELSITTSLGWGMPPVSDVLAVRTQKDFGCIHHLAK